MRVAALYDIHGNLPALEATLRDVHASGADRIVIGGDILPGPMARGVIDRLRAMDTPVQYIMGNGDRAVLDFLQGRALTSVPAQALPAIEASARQLNAPDEAFLASLPPTLSLVIPGPGRVLFCHATPRNDTDIFTRDTPEEQLAPIFAGVSAELVVCGHTHMQFDRTIGGRRVVNAGSVGMPFGRPGAYWLLLGPGVEPRGTAYDVTDAVEQIANADYPDARNFAERYILRPPSEQEMLEAYSKVVLK
jgi:predicted phosphodiesterase